LVLPHRSQAVSLINRHLKRANDFGPSIERQFGKRNAPHCTKRYPSDTNYGVFANAILRYPSLIQPYIGGGIGYSWDNESNGVAFQAMAGVRVKPTEIFSVFAEFKYLIAHREGQVDGIGLEGNYLIPSLVGGATLHF
jgi:opacity protein-like surface antigen